MLQSDLFYDCIGYSEYLEMSFVIVQSRHLASLKNNTDLCGRKPNTKVYGKRYPRRH